MKFSPRRPIAIDFRDDGASFRVRRAAHFNPDRPRKRPWQEIYLRALLGLLGLMIVFAIGVGVFFAAVGFAD